MDYAKEYEKETGSKVLIWDNYIDWLISKISALEEKNKSLETELQRALRLTEAQINTISKLETELNERKVYHSEAVTKCMGLEAELKEVRGFVARCKKWVDWIEKNFDQKTIGKVGFQEFKNEVGKLLTEGE